MDNEKEWINKRIGNYFKLARVKAGLTQAEVAKSLSCHTQYLSNVERGVCSISSQHMRKLIKVYKLSNSQVISDLIKIQKVYLTLKLTTKKFKQQ